MRVYIPISIQICLYAYLICLKLHCVKALNATRKSLQVKGWVANGGDKSYDGSLVAIALLDPKSHNQG